MIKISICDDDEAFACELEQAIMNFAEAKNLKVDLEVFSAGRNFLKI